MCACTQEAGLSARRGGVETSSNDPMRDRGNGRLIAAHSAFIIVQAYTRPLTQTDADEGVRSDLPSSAGPGRRPLGPTDRDVSFSLAFVWFLIVYADPWVCVELP